MSLINDALRRAKQARPETPTDSEAPAPHFRPVEPPVQQATRRGLGLMLPLSLSAIALLALLLLWEFSHKDRSSATSTPQTLTAAARTPTAADSSLAPATPPAQASETPVAANNGGLTTTTVADAPKPIRGAQGNPGASAPEGVSPANTNLVGASDDGNTNHTAGVEPAAPPALKLQGIVFNPKRPSALINGRVLFVGDRVREYRVVAIHSLDVVLAGAGHTNLLSLEP